MKPLVSGVMGALAAGVLMTAWNGRTSAEDEMLVARPAARTVQLGTDASTAGADVTNGFAPVNVQCAPGQRAVVRQLPTPQGTTADVQCVSPYGDDMVAWNGYAQASGSPRVVPAVYSAPAPQRVVYRDRAERRSGRSWKKSALVIGGSAGAGAGVGAIAGGKKGALIGAAIGGGAATLYEAVKHK
jgi:hypothetical protein